MRGSADGILCPLQLGAFKPWVVFENAVAVYTQQEFFLGEIIMKPNDVEYWLYHFNPRHDA